MENYQSVMAWLLISEPWIEYVTRVHLLKETDQVSSADLKQLKNNMLSDSNILKYLTDVSNFHDNIVSTHKNPELSVYKLIFLLDMGLDDSIPEIKQALKHILAHQDEHGVFQSQVNIPKHFGGTGENTWGWCLCDAPVLMQALAKAGVSYLDPIKPGLEYLMALQRENGFPCAVSRAFGKFRGPGKKDDCCPFATLSMLKLFAELPEYKNSNAAIQNIEILLSLWENSITQHPYMFYMGNDFRKLKAPPIWYDLVSVADCLSQFDFIHSDARFQDMLDTIESKMDTEHRFTPESVYLKCKSWDFGQKKTPSPYLTYLCLRILIRTGRINL